jgi:hypothetical protein
MGLVSYPVHIKATAPRFESSSTEGRSQSELDVVSYSPEGGNTSSWDEDRGDMFVKKRRLSFKTTRRYIPEDKTRHNHRLGNPKYYMEIPWFESRSDEGPSQSSFVFISSFP